MTTTLVSLPEVQKAGSCFCSVRNIYGLVGSNLEAVDRNPRVDSYLLQKQNREPDQAWIRSLQMGDTWKDHAKRLAMR